MKKTFTISPGMWLYFIEDLGPLRAGQAYQVLSLSSNDREAPWQGVVFVGIEGMFWKDVLNRKCKPDPIRNVFYHKEVLK